MHPKPFPHQPVLLEEILALFQGRALHLFVDGTLGAGGHAEALLKAHPEIKRYIALDQDVTALEIAKERLIPWQDKITFIHDNFSHMEELLAALQIDSIDGVLIDLGVSSMQFDTPKRGFSFTHDGPLDMRMDTTCHLTAAEIVNHWSEKDLGEIFRKYGEEKQWRQAARTIIHAREKAPIETTRQLAEILNPLFSWKKRGIDPLTLIFQALRICVNDELGILESTLPSAIDLLTPGGRLAVISFHSLEDRLVKNAFRYAASNKQDTTGYMGVFIDKKPTVSILLNKPVMASVEEVSSNPRSRSAKLRAVEKL